MEKMYGIQELSKLFEDKRPQIIVVEGGQGDGKTVTTNEIREQLAHTNMLRLTGGKSNSLEMIKANYVAIQNMLDMLAKNNVDINYVFDRTFTTEWCYRRLGYKGDKESFDEVGRMLIGRLMDLGDVYNITFVVLSADDKTVEKRLKRDKPQYNNVVFCTENSRKQREMFIEILDKEVDRSKANLVVFDTTRGKDVRENVNLLLNEIYRISK